MNIECKKKRKFEIEKDIKKVIEFDIISKKWLIEWDDRSRSWEDYESIKDHYGFKLFIQNTFKKGRERELSPSYIN